MAEGLALPFSVVLVAAEGGLNGACWGTLTFVMVKASGASGPVYVHSRMAIPHVNISLTFLNRKLGPVELLDGAVVDVVVEGLLIVGDDELAVEGEKRATR